MYADRRMFLRGSTAAAMSAVASTSAIAQGIWGDPPTNASTDPRTPFWPARERFALWPGVAPGAPKTRIAANWTMNGPADGRELWLRGVQMPEVHVFRAPRSDGSAILSLPGGGYNFLSVQNEGLDVALNFNPERTTVFVLTYRLPSEGWAIGHVAPLADAQRAMRLIRSRAGELRIDPQRLGVLGFSAGGHLAADLAVAHDESVYAPVDAADQLSAKPAFAGLVYPVVSLRTSDPGGRSMDGLVGSAPSPQVLETRSPLLRVNSSTPPSFLVHAIDDRTVPVANSLAWLQACSAAKVPCEAHLLSEGGHGFGLHLAKDMSGSNWPKMFAQWMRKHGG